MGIGDWGLGIGDWGLGIGQSPIPYINLNLFKLPKIVKLIIIIIDYF
jgi:hypothetical protein